MRNQWRQLLLLKCYRCSPQVNRIQVSPISYSFPQSIRSSIDGDTPFYRSQFLRFFSSSELAVEQRPKDSPFQKEDVFSRTELVNEKIKLELEANNVVLRGDSNSVWKAEKKGEFEFLETFKKDRLDNDSTGNICSSVCRVINEHESWSEDVEKELREMNVEYSSELVSRIVIELGKEELDDDKGLILMFFKWIEESGLFKHDQRTFNAMLKVLAKEDSSERFKKMAEEMQKSGGFEMESETYDVAMRTILKKKTVYDGVDFWEFAMGLGGSDKPFICSTWLVFLMQSIVYSDMELFSLVVRIYKKQGNVVSDSMFEDILRSLKTFGRLGEINKFLKVLEVDSGFVLEPRDSDSSVLDHETWSYLITGFCLSNDLEKASSSLEKMVNNGGIPFAKKNDIRTSTCLSAIETVVEAYCRADRAMDAFSLVSKLDVNLRPWHSTFKTIIRRLLAKEEGGFREALNVLPLMKTKDYDGPKLSVFIEYLSESGSPDDAMAFFDAISSVYECSSTTTRLFLRLFEGYFKLGKDDFARELLFRSPKKVRNNTNVMNLFSGKKSGKNGSVVVKGSAA